MERDTHDAPRWEEAYTADRETAVPDPRTPIDDDPWAVYRGTRAATIAPTYIEAYLEHLDARCWKRDRRGAAARDASAAARLRGADGAVGTGPQ
jgi:hypothetical protein